MSNDILIGQYPRQQCVRDRNYSALLRWAAYNSASQIPTDKPDETWVRARIISDRMPSQIDSYVAKTIPYFMQDPQTIASLRDFLNAFNTDDLEDQLSNMNSAIIGAFIGRLGMAEVTDGEVQTWYDEHGFGTPPA